ncbi:TPA: Arc family DNA-binding protein [Clostridium perfringens]|nr:Arc family DNA-binding protein [Clostridium perfringens]HBC2032328.1 Arc family DNA-binding protein [Clostridium perfringens]HBC2056063.1 Arc family DNA-binding protein [Clostridium perfringens]HBC2069678.1 Arc family DNA-binding protein [Clostridium perfringens]
MSEQKRFTLRMDADLFEVVKKRAEQNKRSIAKEIEYLLEEYLKNSNSDK